MYDTLETNFLNKHMKTISQHVRDTYDRHPYFEHTVAFYVQINAENNLISITLKFVHTLVYLYNFVLHMKII